MKTIKEKLTTEDILIGILLVLLIFAGAYIADKYFPLCKCGL